MIKIKISSVFVNDQLAALEFYTKKLGFIVKKDIPVGEYKWLTVGTEGSEFEMLLEPNAHPASKAYTKAIFEEGIAATTLYVDNIDTEYERLKGLGIEFKSAPMEMGDVKIAVFNDTCGNYIQLCQE